MKTIFLFLLIILQLGLNSCNKKESDEVITLSPIHAMLKGTWDLRTSTITYYKKNSNEKHAEETTTFDRGNQIKFTDTQLFSYLENRIVTTATYNLIDNKRIEFIEGQIDGYWEIKELTNDKLVLEYETIIYDPDMLEEGKKALVNLVYTR